MTISQAKRRPRQGAARSVRKLERGVIQEVRLEKKGAGEETEARPARIENRDQRHWNLGRAVMRRERADQWHSPRKRQQPKKATENVDEQDSRNKTTLRKRGRRRLRGAVSGTCCDESCQKTLKGSATRAPRLESLETNHRKTGNRSVTSLTEKACQDVRQKGIERDCGQETERRWQ